MRSVYEILRAKREGQELPKEEIAYLVGGVVSGEVPEYQAAAFLMAAVILGLSTAETAALTEAMRDSGDCWDLSDLAPVVDKHSTGGVGDKVSLVLAPLVASAGARVGMMSGRGLGHTGGTLDKLAAIPGFRTDLDFPRVREALTKVGAALFAQTDTIAPADRILYALRDVTGTVENLSLIVASILSKKLASGTTGIVFDVKTGDGAFMKALEDSRALGRALVDTSRAAGRQASGWITDMSRPLGRAVGNSLEAEESIRVLRNEGPPAVREICLILGTDMLRFADPSVTEEAARQRLESAFDSGAAARKFQQLIEFQGGDPAVVDDPSRLPAPAQRIPALALTPGYVRSISTEKMGFLSIDIGCGRRKREDTIDLAAGFLVEKTVGDRVGRGEP
ncbi:MAG TPA: thymidine phosphorylase, partial [Thermoanaerobaculia bacterium]|nr:thymidine phosphorylase [Thermoanaerobaculia bacterium]